MFGKRRPVVKFFDLSFLHPIDSGFGIFLAEVANLVRQHKIIQLFIKINDERDKGYVGRRLRSFLEEDVKLPYEKFSVTPNSDEDTLNFVCYTVSLKRKFLGLFWI